METWKLSMLVMIKYLSDIENHKKAEPSKYICLQTQGSAKIRVPTIIWQAIEHTCLRNHTQEEYE